MAKHKIVLDDDVRKVLEAAQIEGIHLRLTGQLDRPLYEKVNKVLMAAGGVWNKKVKAHIFDGDPREVLGLALASGSIVNKKTALQQFFTPPDLVTEMIRQAAIVPNDHVLEPSAGIGNLARAIKAAGGVPFCVEIDEVCVKTLKNTADEIIHGDFLDLSPTNVPPSWPNTFDVVVMNPPFEKDQDIAHAMHATKFLDKGGRIVAIMSPGFTYGLTKVRKDFAAFIARHGKYTTLPEGTFKESGTNVRTVMVKITM